MSKNRVNSPRPIPVPTMGIDLRVPITSMPPQYSPFLINFHCRTGKLVKRRPHTIDAASSGAATGGSGNVPKIIARKSSGQVIAISSDYIWDNLGTTPVQKSLYSMGMTQHYVDYWDDGDGLFVTDNDGVFSINTTTLVPTLAFTDASVDDRRPITKYRERFYWATGTSLSYSNAGAVSGTVTAFPANVTDLIEALATYNYGTNSRSEQMLVVLSRRGELLIYAGTYPGGTDWYQVHGFQLGEGDSNGEYSWDMHEIEGDVLINHKHSHKVYSLRGLLSNEVGKGEWDLSDRIEGLWTDLGRDYAYDFSSIKNMTYWPSQSAIVMMVRFFSVGVMPWLDAWKGVSLPGFKDDAADSHYHFIIYFDLTTKSITLHTYPTVARDFTSFVFSCPSAGRDGIYLGDYATISATGRGVIVKMFDDERDAFLMDWDGSTNATVVYSSYSTFAPQAGVFDHEKANFVLMFSNLYDSHDFSYGFNQNFNHSPATTFNSFSNGATIQVARADLLDKGFAGNGLVFQIKESSDGGDSSVYLFEFFGAKILEEIGGLF